MNIGMKNNNSINHFQLLGVTVWGLVNIKIQLYHENMHDFVHFFISLRELFTKANNLPALSDSSSPADIITGSIPIAWNISSVWNVFPCPFPPQIPEIKWRYTLTFKTECIKTILYVFILIPKISLCAYVFSLVKFKIIRVNLYWAKDNHGRRFQYEH